MEYTRLTFDGFDWDQGNILKAQLHGVSLEEIEAIFFQKTLFKDDFRHSSDEQRWIAIGFLNGTKGLFVSYTFRIRGNLKLIRAISARYMHRKEQIVYERIKKELGE